MRLRELPVVWTAWSVRAAMPTRLVGAIPADVLTETQPELIEVAATLDPYSPGQ